MDHKNTDVVILCGGLGTRLRSAVADRPKPMAEVSHKPFLEILVDYVALFGFKRFVFCVGYRAEVIKEHFRRCKGVEVVFSEEPEPLGTAGALKLCEPLLHSEVFLVLNGDSICPVNLSSLLYFHRRRSGIASIVLVQANGRADGGSIGIGEGNRILSFEEKYFRSRERFLNAGVYVLEREAFAFFQEGQRCSLEQEVFPRLIEKGIYGYLTPERLYDIGTPERLERFRRLYSEGGIEKQVVIT